jgi:predicted DNA-binding transcriptional regulator YafY
MGIWDGKVVEFVYTNYRGVTEIRRVVPQNIWFGATQWHPKRQWFLSAWCLERQAHRDFAWSNIEGWEEAEDQSLPWRK